MGYIGKLQAEASNTQTKVEYLASEGQTTFLCSYSPNYVDVHLNGVLLSKTDYTATSGTSIVLATGASANDIIQITADNVLGLVDGYTQAEVDAQIGSHITDTEIKLQNVNGGTLTLQYAGTSSNNYTVAIPAKNCTLAGTDEVALKAPLASPTFTGTPTAPTAPAETNTTQLATTAFVHAVAGGTTTPAASMDTNGYVKFASGLVIQWGRVSVTGATTATVTLPLTFPTSFCSVTIGDQSASNADQMVDILSTSQFTVYAPAADGTGNGTKWIAIGY